MKFAICNEIFQGWELESSMTFARTAGYDAIELAPFTLASRITEVASPRRQRIRDAADRAGISISGIHWVLAHTEGMHLNHPDATIRRQTSGYLRELVDFCADVGGRTMVVGSPKQRQVLTGVSYQEAWSWAGATFRECVQQAEQRGVIVCLEPLAPAETNFINTAEEAIRFIKENGSPNFRIILDVKAMCSESKPIAQVIEESWPHFAYFHANDRNLKGPGFGEIDFRPIAAALRGVGYDGVVSVEVFDFEEGPEVIATRSIDYLRRTFA